MPEKPLSPTLSVSRKLKPRDGRRLAFVKQLQSLKYHISFSYASRCPIFQQFHEMGWVSSPLYWWIKWGSGRLVTQSHLTLCNPTDCSRPGSSVHRILQPRILEWAAISSSRGSSQPRERTQVSHTAGRFFAIWATGFPGGSKLVAQW